MVGSVGLFFEPSLLGSSGKALRYPFSDKVGIHPAKLTADFHPDVEIERGAQVFSGPHRSSVDFAECRLAHLGA
jgi:hypothetical protein